MTTTTRDMRTDELRPGDVILGVGRLLLIDSDGVDYGLHFEGRSTPSTWRGDKVWHGVTRDGATTTVRDRLAAIVARADAATEGPWWLSAERPTVGVVAKRESGDLGGGPSLVAETWTLRSNRAANAEFIAESRQDVPDLVAALLAVLDVAEWHEIKADKARRFPGEGRNAEMAKAAEVHDDAARRIRTAAAKHLGGAS